MEENGSLYQAGFAVLKQQITRMVALSLSMVALLLLVLLFGVLIGLNYQLRMVAIWQTEYLFTPEWLFALAWLALCMLVCLPFEMGVRWWFYEACIGQGEPPLGLVFQMFESGRLYFKSFWFRLVLGARKLFWYAVFLLPSLLLSFLLAHPVSYSGVVIGTAYGMLRALWLLSVAGGLCGAFYYNLKYYLTYPIWFETPELSVMEAARRSVRAMRGNRNRALAAYLSLLPLAFSCVLVFPVLMMVPSAYLLLSIQGKRILNLQQKDVS